jgi:hypothetical protein
VNARDLLLQQAEVGSRQGLRNISRLPTVDFLLAFHYVNMLPEDVVFNSGDWPAECTAIFTEIRNFREAYIEIEPTSSNRHVLALKVVEAATKDRREISWDQVEQLVLEPFYNARFLFSSHAVYVSLTMSRDNKQESLFELKKNYTAGKGYDGEPATSRWAIGFPMKKDVVQEMVPIEINDAAFNPFLAINNSYKFKESYQWYDVEHEGAQQVRRPPSPYQESKEIDQFRRMGWVVGYMHETWCLYAVPHGHTVS